ncbi:fimbria/pilus outer membrane usher protein [Candidatus Synechococcus calcipolaris G9]|uniref:Fimbria/pilus outer membrane usher protein n=1 Tax=Candidatus Synechococcus calcipolaris G9 TaxID=1497997 RepID=A0ABT6F3H1_9SYNE|nr:fimbria/pilus outer membrane usher protein [Candidatus Synechococcus calcipolaris]MDG2992360.1 fimbria/pilus outer membrane usher protein [Candidatus Synechococcus calcipolaris G9]
MIAFTVRKIFPLIAIILIVPQAYAAPDALGPDALGVDGETGETPQGIEPESDTPDPPPSPNQDALFEEVFGRPRTPRGVQRVVVPFFINDLEQGQVLVFIGQASASPVQIQADPFLVRLATFLRPELQQTLEANVSNEGNLPLEALQQVGLEALFNERTLELRVDIPPVLRRTSIYNLSQVGAPPEAATAVRPATVSGFLNVRGGQDVVWTGPDSELVGRQPLSLNFDGAFNLKNWVFEGSTTYTELGNPEFVQGDLRLVRDDPLRGIRYAAGNLNLSTTGYQAFVPMLGLSASRNFTLQPYLTIQPRGNFQFTLDTPSEVEIYVNGFLRQTLTLPAGPQDLRDLPLNVGVNNISLVITNAVGQVQQLNFSAAVASDLLAQGIQQFSYNIGFPVDETTSGTFRNYDVETPLLIAAHRVGLTNALTMGGYTQADPNQQLLGLETVKATPLGNIRLDTGLSHFDGNVDYGLRLRYEYLDLGPQSRWQPVFRLALERRGGQFRTFDDRISSLFPEDSLFLQGFDWSVSSSYSQRLPAGITGNVGFNYRRGRVEDNLSPDSYSASVGLGRSFPNGLGVNLNLVHRQDTSGEQDHQVLLNLQWLFAPRQSINSQTSISQQNDFRHTLRWNYRTQALVNGFTTNITGETLTEENNLLGNLNYTGFRNELAVLHRFNSPIVNDTTLRANSRTTFGTAFVFADRAFALSRPVTGSFAIITRNPALGKQTVGVNPSLNNYVAQADRFGPAVVPNLTPYYVTSLRMDAPDLPLGYDLGDTQYNVFPTYKSGLVIQVGTDASVFLRGELRDAQGEPLGLITADVDDLSDPDRPSVILFTNRVGRFALEGFRPGRYQIRFRDRPGPPLTFDIPETQTGLYDLGTLTVP